MWYDFFSLFYDGTLEKLYRKPRAEAVAALQVTPGSLVLDIACGTGQNFEPLQSDIIDGTLVGVDLSGGMLKRAQKRVEKAGWTNVHLVESDIHDFSAETLETLTGRTTVDFAICALGLTLFDQWEAAFAHGFDLLRPGGRFAVFDVHAEKRTFQTRNTELVSGGDLSRQVWKPLEQVAQDFALQYLPGSPALFGGRLFVATGVKPDPLSTRAPQPPNDPPAG